MEPLAAPAATYEFEHVLGAGGFGVVYAARRITASGVSIPVAVKLLRSDLDPHSHIGQRLRDEARMLASLEHGGLAVVDCTILDGRLAIVAQRLHGQDMDGVLKAVKKARTRLPPRVVVEIVHRVAGTLDAALSGFKLVHRDVKPANIYLERDGTVRLMDLGLSRATIEGREAATSMGTGFMGGTLQYLAPERLSGDAIAASAPPVDVFALGCVLYEGLAAGRLLAFAGDLMALAGMAAKRERSGSPR